MKNTIILLISLLAISILARGQGEIITIKDSVIQNPEIIMISEQMLPITEDCIQPEVSVEAFGQVLSYIWEGPNAYTSTELRPCLSALGLYTLTATNTFGCSSTASLTLRGVSPFDTTWTVERLPSMCQGSRDSIILRNFVAQAYNTDGTFSGPGVRNGILYDSIAGIDQEVIWHIGDKELPIFCSIYPRPNVTTQKDTIFGCSGESVALMAVGLADSYRWFNGIDTLLGSNHMVPVDPSRKFFLEASVNHTDRTCSIVDSTLTKPISAEFTILQYVDSSGNTTMYGSAVWFKAVHKSAASYLWDFGYTYNPTTSTEVAPKFNYGYYGTYRATLTINEPMCLSKESYTYSMDIKVNMLVAVDDLDVSAEKNIFKPYPNPMLDVVNLVIRDIDLIQVFDLSGKCIKQVSVDSKHFEEEISIDVSDLRPGIYFIRILKASRLVSSSKLIKI